MENILELQQVSKTFSKSNFALENVTFSLPYGSILGFVGENGAGKTTTIGCILNTIAKDSGMVKLFGKEMTDADTDMRERIGVVYDGDNAIEIIKAYLENRIDSLEIVNNTYPAKYARKTKKKYIGGCGNDCRECDCYECIGRKR